MVKTNRSWEPRKKPLQGRSRETVGFVLEAAAQLFGELGYEGTTTNNIADKAGVSIGSVYQYFPNKEALLLALAERHLDDAREYGTVALRRLREQKPTPEEFFRGFLGNVVDFHSGGESLHDLFFEEAPRTERLWELVAALDAACAAEVEIYLRELGLGGPGPSLKSLMLARIIGNMGHEMVLNPPPGFTSEACTEEVVAVCLGYLGCRSDDVLATETVRG